MRENVGNEQKEITRNSTLIAALFYLFRFLDFWHSGNESTCDWRRQKETRVRFLGQADPLEGKWQPIPVSLLG